MKNKVLLFVYGTLLRGEYNHHRLAAAPCVHEQAWVNGELVDTGCGYPALILGGQTQVNGEIYELEDQQLLSIDELEGFYGVGDAGNYYERLTVNVHTASGDRTALTYVFTPGKARGMERIDSGDWRIYTREGY